MWHVVIQFFFSNSMYYLLNISVGTYIRINQLIENIEQVIKEIQADQVRKPTVQEKHKIICNIQAIQAFIIDSSIKNYIRLSLISHILKNLIQYFLSKEKKFRSLLCKSFKYSAQQHRILSLLQNPKVCQENQLHNFCIL